MAGNKLFKNNSLKPCKLLENSKKGIVIELEGENINTGKTQEKIGYFQEKYRSQVNFTIEIKLNHPFLEELKKSLDYYVVGQNKAKDYLSKTILNSVLRIGENKGPLGVFFFYGPTGVGKTEMVKALANTMFGDDNAFIKINCENLQQSHTSSTLFGAPPGYIGFDKQPRLTNKNITTHFEVAKQMKRLNKIISGLNGFSIILFDEIEKAHTDVIQQLLGLIDEGKVVISNGEVVNFENSIIIFTSNIGQKEIYNLKQKNGIGFSQKKEPEKKEIEELFKKCLKEKLSLEFISRIHNFIEFEELSKDDCKEIIDIQVNKFNKYLLKYFTESHIQIELSPKIYDYVIKNGYSKEKGARELIRTYNYLVKAYIDILFHSDDFQKYYDYPGKVIIGIDLDENEKLNFCIILDDNTIKETTEIKLLENKEQISISLKKLNEIFETISGYIELTYINLDDDIDLKDELKIYANKLKSFGLSQKEISSLKNIAYIEGLRDMIFIQDFEELGLVEKEKNLFHPFENRTIIKIVEGKLKNIYKNYKYSAKKFVFVGLKDTIETITKLLKVNELSGAQINQLLFYIRKTIVEKYGINIDY